MWQKLVGEKNISPEQLGDLGNVNEIFLETFWHTEV